MKEISQRMRRHWITRRRNGNDTPWNKKLCSDEYQLRILYIDEKKSTRTIAKHFGVTQHLIMIWLKRAEIKTRPNKERALPHPMKGKRYGESTIKKRSGSNHYNWQGGITSLNHKLRHSRDHTEWRLKVFQRDNYTCQNCGVRSKKGKRITLHADHIKPFALYPSLRLLVSNGKTLCVSCHRKTPTYSGRTRKVIETTLCL